MNTTRLPRTLTLAMLLAIPLGLFGCAAETRDENSDVSATDENGDEISQELQGKPKYTLSSRAILGTFADPGDCRGYSCEDAKVTKTNGKVTVSLGWEGRYAASAWASNGVILFSTQEYDDDFDDCQDPGCGNVNKVTGVIYPVKKNGKWVPQMKATFKVNFPYPDDPEAPEGIVSYTSYLRKK
ncbi:MAG: hypothetical protein U0174_28100 [Polyangiaceae bacterium]